MKKGEVLAAADHRSLVAGRNAVVAAEPIGEGRRETLAGTLHGIAATMHEAVAKMGKGDIAENPLLIEGLQRDRSN